MVNEDFLSKSKLSDIGRWYANQFVNYVAKSLPNGSSILDAGAGESAYKSLFEHCDYKAIDLAVGESRWNYSNLDFIGPLDDMPIEDAQFDAVLCTQVLEHLEWPRESAAEMCRVLKPGGRIYITVPMSHGEHQIPYDFFRYTSYGLKSILSHAGFSEIRVNPCGGFLTRWAYEMPRIFSIFPPTGLRSGNYSLIGISLLPIKVLLIPLVRLVQFSFMCFERFDKKKNFPLGWSCEAVKPSAGKMNG
jgi:SAM-dependent methyltransferase